MSSEEAEREAEVAVTEDKKKKASPAKKEKKKQDKKHKKHKKHKSKKDKKHGKDTKKNKKAKKSEDKRKSGAAVESKDGAKKAAPKRKKPEGVSAKPKAAIKLKNPADALAEFPQAGLSLEAPDRQRRIVSRILFESDVSTALCTEEEYTRINRDKTANPRPEQVCWIELSVEEYAVKATSLALRQTDKPGLYFPMNFNAEKRFVKACYGFDYPKFKDKVKAYQNRLPLILGLEEHAGEFNGISFVSDRWYLKDEAGEGAACELQHQTKALFSETRAYVPIAMRVKVGNMMDTMDVDDQVEDSYDGGAGGELGEEASSSAEDKSIRSSEESGQWDDDEDEEDVYDDEERDEKKQLQTVEPIAKKQKTVKAKTEKPVPDYEAGVYEEKPGVQNEAFKMVMLDKLIAPRTSPDEVKAIIQQCNETFAVHLTQGESLYEIGVFSVSRVEKTAKFLEKTAPPEKRNTVKFDIVEEPKREATPPPPPQSIPPPQLDSSPPPPEEEKEESKQTPPPPPPPQSETMPSEKTKKRSADEAKVPEKSNAKKPVSPASGALRPKFLNHAIALSIKKFVTDKPENRTRFDRQADYAEMLTTEFSFSQLVGSAKELEQRWPLLYPLLQLWFEFYCQEHRVSVESKSVNDVVREWVKSMEAAKVFDMVIKADVQLVPEDEAAKSCLFKLVEKAARGQANMTERVRRLFNPTGKLFKLFPENDGLSEEDYRSVFRASADGKATLFTVLTLYERASAAGTCIWKESAAPPPPPEDEEPEF